MEAPDEKRQMLRHFLGALAYRTQKALRGAPPSFADFRAGERTRSPLELVRHMTGVLGYANQHFDPNLAGGWWSPPPAADWAEEVRRFHAMLEGLSKQLVEGAPLYGTTLERLLQGPFSDAMTHVGQLAMLRRLAGFAVPPENFIKAAVSAENVSAIQPDPVSPDKEWPEGPNPSGGWPEGYFEEVAGSWVGDFERPPQGEFEEREPLD